MRSYAYRKKAADALSSAFHGLTSAQREDLLEVSEAAFGLRISEDEKNELRNGVGSLPDNLLTAVKTRMDHPHVFGLVLERLVAARRLNELTPESRQSIFEVAETHFGASLAPEVRERVIRGRISHRSAMGIPPGVMTALSLHEQASSLFAQVHAGLFSQGPSPFDTRFTYGGVGLGSPRGD